MNHRALSFLALLLLPAASPAQNWLHSDNGEVAELRILYREDGVLIDLARDDAFDHGYVRRHGFDGQTIDGFAIHTVFGGTARPSDMALLPNGHIVIVGSHESDTGDPCVPWIGVFDPDTATTQWVKRFSTNHMLFTRVVVSGDRIFAVGRDTNYQTLVTAKMDFAGGVDWTREWGLAGQPDNLRDICPTASGDLVAVVRDSNDHSHIFYLTAAGQVAWHRYHDTFFAQAVCETPNGEVWVGGERFDGGEAVMVLSANNTMLRRKRYLAFPGVVRDIYPRPDGGVLLTGTRIMGDLYNASIMALAADGTVDWCRAYDQSEFTDWEGGSETVHVPGRGWIVRGQTNGYLRLLAVNDDGTADVPCVDITNIAALAIDASFGPDEPPPVWSESWSATVQPWILQPTDWNHELTHRCGAPCRVLTSSYGQGTYGTQLITPELSATGGACAGRPYPLIELEKGLGGTVGAFAFSTAVAHLPVLGGILYLDPQTLVTVPIVLDGSSALPGDGTWSLELTAGLLDHAEVLFAMQVLLADAGAPQGLSMSNAVLMSADI